MLLMMEKKLLKKMERKLLERFTKEKRIEKKKSRGKVINYILNGNAMKVHLIVG